MKLSVMKASVLWGELSRSDKSDIATDLTQTESKILPENLTNRSFGSLSQNQKRTLAKAIGKWLN